MLDQGRIPAAVVVGVDTVCNALAEAAVGRMPLAEARVQPFDQGASGVGFGSAAVAIVLERADDAARRGVVARSQVLGGASGGDRGRSELPATTGSFVRCHALALERARVDPAEIDLVVASAPGIPDVDRAEARAIAKTFRHGPLVTTLTGTIGECRGAGSALGAVLASRAFAEQCVPPVAGLVAPVSDELEFVKKAAVGAPVHRAIVVSSSPGGTYSAVVLGEA
jgi:act minimal PKS chain-length factor (CLF/KS beta)